ncbi:SurA N-terminal domain-containing protein [Gracilibacillus sp. S3-1-1]|uniref:SurA N-terminal domain-containing protein n=1 Tax=Gracilibacillus pellucidus TaxID=3095368 RepID=A0ACC6M0M6_9BACI|nr:SurA N-terminal domain-containing protein [Gracilibacillus sp. S3-1-1]MDX8044432.1 SurA N-terminal domain-containing protein [Gracilibacillus sp. S3-1-1]
MKKIMMLFVMISLSIVIVACGNNANDDDAEQQPPKDIVSDEERVDENEAVATINGEEISGSAYNTMYMLVKTTLQQYEQDIDDTDTVKEQTLQELITQELIRQDAQAEGITVDETEIDQELNNVKEHYGDNYTTILENSGFTEETYKKQVEQELLSTKYLQTVFDIHVTDEEIDEFYQALSEETEDSEEELPALEDVKTNIEQQLLAEKQQEKQEDIQAKLDELREDADIEELI